MKLTLTLIMVLCFTLMVKAQVEKTLDVTAGNLAKLLSNEELTTITSLKLRGTINALDFSTMHGEMKRLRHIDLGETTVEAYVYPGSRDTILKANEIPYNAINYSILSIILPSNITRINFEAFYMCSILKSVVLPPSVKIIEDGAFWGCRSLTSLYIPDQVTAIGEYAFYECSSLESINIPPLMTTIADCTFIGCNSLTSITIPHSVISIGSEAFAGCISLDSISIPSSVTSIGNGAFAGCHSFTSITIPSSVTSMGEFAFGDCSSLTSISISSLTTISAEAFLRCRALTAISIPPSVRSIKNSAFTDCDHLQSVLLPRSVTSIGDSAFAGCHALVELILPSSNVSIGKWAFSSCINLTSVTFPALVKKIGINAFHDCTNLNVIYANRAVPWDLENPTFSGMDKTTCRLQVPFGSVPLYAAANEWKDFTTIVADTAGFMTSANAIRFEVNGGVFNLRISSNVSWKAKSDQSWLRITPDEGDHSETLVITAEANDLATNRTAAITITAEGVSSQILKVTQVSDPEVVPISAGNLSLMFTTAEKQSITSLTLAGTINAWDLSTIQQEMPALTYLDLSKTATKETHGPLNIWYFDNWMPGSVIENTGWEKYELTLSKPLLTTLKLPSALEMIGCFAFKGCSGLTSVSIPSTVQEIGYGAFAKCKSLSSITIPSSVIYMDREVFLGCSNLKEVKINGELSVIRRSTFSGCTSLDSIALPSSLRVIYLYAFDSCTALTSIVLPDSLIKIDVGAFRNCINLASIYTYSPIPPSTHDSFMDVNKATCILYVPFRSRRLYSNEEEWKEFKNIVEMPGFNLSTSTVYVKNGQGSNASATIDADVAWTVSSDQPWLTVNPVSGEALDSITFTTDENPSEFGRVAVVTVSANGLKPKRFTVIQDGLPKTIHLTAGNLSQVLTAEELKGIVNLTITGEIDARDFSIMNNKMPLLSVVDLSKATITSYAKDSYSVNNDNEIPANAFYYPHDNFIYNEYNIIKKSSLTSFLLPNSTKIIGAAVFENCIGLTTITIPPTVSFIDNRAFSHCTNLISIYSYADSPPVIAFPYYDYSHSFYRINNESCILYVPYGSKERYTQASIWQEFKNIIEMPGFLLQADTLNVDAKQGSQATAELTGNIQWLATSDQPWLTVNPPSGTVNQILTFTADANPADTTRTATVTVTATDIDPQTIVISQLALTTGVAEKAQNRPLIKCYPNPFTTEMAVEITNPSLSKVTVDIFSYFRAEDQKPYKGLKMGQYQPELGWHR